MYLHENINELINVLRTIRQLHKDARLDEIEKDYYNFMILKLIHLKVPENVVFKGEHHYQKHIA